MQDFKSDAPDELEYVFDCLNHGRFSEVISLATSVVESLPDNHLQRGRAYYARSCAYQGLAEKNRAIDDISRAIDCLSTGPSDFIAALTLHRANLYRELGQDGSAETDLCQVINTFTGVVTQPVAAALVTRGALYFARLETEKAIKDWNAAVDIPGIKSTILGGAFQHRGIALMQIGQVDNAEEDFTQVIDHLPEVLSDSRCIAYLHRGKIRLLKEQFPEASEDFSEMLKLFPAAQFNYLHEALLGRGVAYYKIGSLDDSIADLTQVIDTDKDCNSFRRNEALRWRMECNLGKGSYIGAFDDATLILSQNDLAVEHFSAATRGLACVKISRGKIKESQALLRSILERHDCPPDEEAAVLLILACTSIVLTDWDTARARLNNLVRCNYGNNRINHAVLYYRGYLCYVLDDVEESIKLLTELINDEDVIPIFRIAALLTRAFVQAQECIFEFAYKDYSEVLSSSYLTEDLRCMALAGRALCGLFVNRPEQQCAADLAEASTGRSSQLFYNDIMVVNSLFYLVGGVPVEAEKCARRLHKSNKALPQQRWYGMLLKALAMYMSEEYSSALDAAVLACESANDNGPQATAALEITAKIKMVMGRAASALDDCSKALSMVDDECDRSVSLLTLKSEAHEALGQSDLAYQAAKRATEFAERQRKQ